MRPNSNEGVLGGVVDDLAAGRAALLDGHADGVEDQFGAQVVGHGPADDAPGVGVGDHREVEKALPGAQIADVGDPQPVRSSCAELALHQVGGRRG